MSNPNAPYSHPGPSYYHSPPPPPQFSYAPGLGGMPYYPPYPMNPMNGQSPPHQPASPRLNGGGRGGYHPHRAGGPSYQHFHHVPPPHFLPQQPMVPQPPIPPPGNPYAPAPQKYAPHLQQMSYPPAFPPPPNGHFNPAWPTQTLSPLPKQLSMPAQLPTPTSATGSPAPPPPKDVVPEAVAPTAQAVSVSLPVQPRQPERVETLPATVFAPSSPGLPQPTLEPAESSPLSQTVHVHAPPDRSPTPKSPASTTSRLSQSQVPPSSFAIWSRKPRDPAKSLGVIISTRAHPPPKVIGEALDVRTPPQSPKLRSKDVAALHATVEANAAHSSQESVKVVTEVALVASSSVTDTTPTSSTLLETPAPGSPLSSHTSVSVAASSSPSTHTKPIASPVASTAAVLEDAAQPSQPSTSSESGAPTVGNVQASIPAPTPVAPAVPPPKKSWASLLQTGDAAASSSKSRLPTSLQVGFSIPAGLSNGSSAHVTASGHPVQPELLKLLNQGPSGPVAPPKIRPRGLINSGNMCFANVVLQTFVYCAPFHRLFTELGKFIAGPVVGSQKEGTKATPLVDGIIQFLKEFALKEPEFNSKSKGKEREEDFDDLDSFIPAYVYDVMKEKKRFASMVGGHQEDAEEFLGFFLDALEDELLSITQSSMPKAEESSEANQTPEEGWLEVGKKNRSVVTRTVKSSESPITRIFGGRFRSTLKAPHQRDSVTVEDWRALRLDIQSEQVTTIKDALQTISHPHSVEITIPTRPGVIIEATRQELIEALPPILILHLKRFLYDTNVGDVVKIGKHVTFGPDLEIGSELLSPTCRSLQPVKYQLFGVIYHHGQSASGGHYTLDVLHPNRDLSERPRQAWIRIDDELVSDIRPEDIFGAQERDDRCAYLLFYKRLGPSKPWSQIAS